MKAINNAKETSGSRKAGILNSHVYYIPVQKRGLTQRCDVYLALFNLYSIIIKRNTIAPSKLRISRPVTSSILSKR